MQKFEFYLDSHGVRGLESAMSPVPLNRDTLGWFIKEICRAERLKPSALLSLEASLESAAMATSKSAERLLVLAAQVGEKAQGGVVFSESALVHSAEALKTLAAEQLQTAAALRNKREAALLHQDMELARDAKQMALSGRNK